jgi:hypothetical protein
MAIVPKTGKRKIDIDGPDGNAYVLLGIANQTARQLEWDAEAIIKEMTSSDYKNLISVFDKYFGDIFDLETEQERFLE